MALLTARRGVFAQPTAAPVTGYAATVLATAGLKSYWRLGDTASPVTDSKGSINGTVSGGTLGAASLLPSDSADTAWTPANFLSYIDFGANYRFPGRVPFSVEFLLKPSALSAGRTFCGSADLGSTGWYFGSVSPSAGGVRVSRNGDTQDLGVVIFTVGVTTHFVYVYDGTNSIFYGDGALAGTIAHPISVTASTANLRLSTVPSGNGQLGTFDEFAIYDVALSAATILAHHNAR